MGDRFARSLQIVKETFAVLRSNPGLALFPILSAIAVVLVSIPFAVPLVLLAIGQSSSHHPQVFGVLHYVLLAGFYFANYFVIIFFNSALVACAHEELNGRHRTLAFGVETAIKRIWQILGWTLIASTVGLILRTLSERTGIIGKIVVGLVGMAWNIAVFFAVPCLVLDGVGPIEAVKTSTSMLKKTWGERIIVNVGMSMITVPLALFVLLPSGMAIFAFVAHFYIAGAFLIGLALIYLGAVAIVSSALTTIYQTALYLYCRDGLVPAGFNSERMQGAFTQRKPDMVSKIRDRVGR